jgi:nitrate reductase NapE component
LFILVLHHLGAFGYIVWIIKMETKQYGTNILVATMARQA